MWSARRDRRGFVSLEFAIGLPMLFVLLLGGSDLVALLRAQLRADLAAQQLGQVVSQCNRISAPGDIDVFWLVAQRSIGDAGAVTGAMAPGAVIVSAVGRSGNDSRVMWQQRTGSPLHISRVGTAGNIATLPGGFQVAAGQTLFVTEVYLRPENWPLAGRLLGGSSQRTLGSFALFVARAPDAPALLAPPANDPSPVCTA